MIKVKKNMAKIDDEKLFIKLGWKILEHKFRYYVLHSPSVQDHEYDRLEREYDALALKLGVTPTASDMVGWKADRPACILVAGKVRMKG